MLKGQNTDLEIDGRQFHVQTEDWGKENPFIVTRIFNAGKVIYTIKTDYASWVNSEIIEFESKLQKALEIQHDDTINEVRSGKWLE